MTLPVASTTGVSNKVQKIYNSQNYLTLRHHRALIPFNQAALRGNAVGSMDDGVSIEWNCHEADNLFIGFKKTGGKLTC